MVQYHGSRPVVMGLVRDADGEARGAYKYQDDGSLYTGDPMELTLTPPAPKPVSEREQLEAELQRVSARWDEIQIRLESLRFEEAGWRWVDEERMPGGESLEHWLPSSMSGKPACRYSDSDWPVCPDGLEWQLGSSGWSATRLIRGVYPPEVREACEPSGMVVKGTRRTPEQAAMEECDDD